eukprot:2149055-Amphidinium_carterae.1
MPCLCAHTGTLGISVLVELYIEPFGGQDGWTDVWFYSPKRSTEGALFCPLASPPSCSSCQWVSVNQAQLHQPPNVWKRLLSTSRATTSFNPLLVVLI